MWSLPSMPLPDDFLSSKNNKPMGHCMLCGKNLLTDNSPYLIEKAFQKNMISKNFELVFEYALCSECQQNTTKELSKESLANIKMYFELYVDFEKRQAGFDHFDKEKYTECMQNCIITKKPITDYNEYQIGGYFYRNQLLTNNLPFAIGGKAINELQDVISKKTRDFLDRFKEKVIPPGVTNKVPDDFLILI
jgi:hypothetical protein